MQITKEYIEESERILIPGKKFDYERLLFINTFKSCDLLAVPGSGKTTALQAKLFCLSKNLPLPNNQGLLILSHTNTAVIEIKNKLQAVCPKLFEYPNFVGTVQDFVDTFLAIPYYHRKYGHQITRIDKNLYDELFTSMFFKSKRRGDVVWNWFVNRGKCPLEFNNKMQNGVMHSWDYRKQKTFVCVSNPPKSWKENITLNISHIIDKLQGLKNILLSRGVLNYDDCYFLAQQNLAKNPLLIDLLRLRFPYVFIDETQDLQLHQIELIDTIFDCEQVCLQRVGDVNQAIFHSGNERKECSWEPRNFLTINNSMRVTSEIAGKVNPFMANRKQGQNIIGLRYLDKRIPTFLFVYDFEHKDRLKQRFVDLINYYHLPDSYEGQKYGFHIIGWNACWLEREAFDSQKLRLADIFPESSVSKSMVSTNFKTLDEYMYESRKLHTTGKKCRLVETIICDCLNFCHQKFLLDKGGKSYECFFTPMLLSKYVEKQPPTFVDEYKSRFLTIVRLMSMSKYEELHEVILKFIKWFMENLSIAQTERLQAFLNSEGSIIETEKSKDDILVEKVHNVKGQTHCATLYVETMYQGAYESIHVLNKIKKKATKKAPEIYYSNPFYKETSVINEGVYARSALKMIYVGMSRPTHLLCYAMHKSSFSQYDQERLIRCGWHILDLTKEI